MTLHELLNYIRPTQRIHIRTYGWGEDYVVLVKDKPYNEVTLVEAFDYMQSEVTEIEAIDNVLFITFDDEDEDYDEEEY